MGSITLNKPSGGQLTISPEDGTSNETVTIPSAGVGKVLQTQYVEYTGSQIATSTLSDDATVATGIYVDFTPKRTDSLIHVTLTWNHMHNGGNGGTAWTVRRDGTSLATGNGITQAYLDWNVNSTTFHTTPTGHFIDTPNTSSTLRYEMYFSNVTGGTATIRTDWGKVTLIVQEVAA